MWRNVGQSHTFTKNPTHRNNPTIRQSAKCVAYCIHYSQPQRVIGPQYNAPRRRTIHIYLNVYTTHLLLNRLLRARACGAKFVISIHVLQSAQQPVFVRMECRREQSGVCNVPTHNTPARTKCPFVGAVVAVDMWT